MTSLLVGSYPQHIFVAFEGGSQLGKAKQLFQPMVQIDQPQLAIIRNDGLRGIGQGVFEVVGMFSVSDVDVQLASEADELAGSGIGDDGDA